jgi:hypothetical protein
MSRQPRAPGGGGERADTEQGSGVGGERRARRRTAAAARRTACVSSSMLSAVLGIKNLLASRDGGWSSGGTVVEDLLGEVLRPLFYQDSQVGIHLRDWFCAAVIDISFAHRLLPDAEGPTVPRRGRSQITMR